MSPLWPERLGVVLYPERMVLARTAGLRRRLVHKETVPLAQPEPGAPIWQAALNALGERTAAGHFGTARVSVILSSHFVHYAVVPWSESISGKAEELAYARHCFTRVYGAAAEDWEVRLSQAAARKPRLACAVEGGLMRALDAHLAPLAGRFRSLQPHLMTSFNRVRNRIGERSAWLALAEPRLVCLALWQDASWHSVRAFRVGSDWAAELPALIEREQCLIETGTDCRKVVVVSAEDAQVRLPRSEAWQFECLVPLLLPGMIAGDDAPYSLAVGA